MINDLEMRKKLLDRTEKEDNEQEPRTEVYQPGDFLEDEVDREFWIKVSLI